MSNFCFDIETLGTESNSIVLSAAICQFEYAPKELKEKGASLAEYYQTLLSSTLFVKFDVDEQIAMKRKIDKSTLEWWNKQEADIKKISIKRSDSDVSAAHGLLLLRDYITRFRSKKSTVWIRGNLDQCCIDSLARSAGVQEISPFWTYRDVRTAIDLLAESSKGNGYCDLCLPFDKDTLVKKHDPRHDVAYDILMLTCME